jgi:RecA/RadA recombinase
MLHVKKAKPTSTPELFAVSRDAKVLNIDDVVRDVRKQMGMRVFVPETKFTLKTQWPELDRAISTSNGIPYGSIIEISGPESHGKSVIQKLIYGEAQRDGAVVIHGDIEKSNDEPWNAKLGVDNDELILVEPKMIYTALSKEQKQANKDAKADYVETSKGKGPKWKLENPISIPYPPESMPKRPQSAEEIFEEIQGIVSKLHDAGVEKMVVGIDSIANLSTENQIEAGMHQNMRTNADLSMFLSGALKQWQIMAANYQVLIILINQIREKPGQMFGDPTYEPGGRALRHNCHSRNRVHRKGDGRVYQQGKLIGINGVLRNRKNKTGEGSVEQLMVEYRVTWDGRPLGERVTFKSFTKSNNSKSKSSAEDDD